MVSWIDDNLFLSLTRFFYSVSSSSRSDKLHLVLLKDGAMMNIIRFKVFVHYSSPF